MVEFQNRLGKEVVIVSLGFRWENLLITHSAFLHFFGRICGKFVLASYYSLSLSVCVACVYVPCVSKIWSQSCKTFRHLFERLTLLI